MTDTKFGGGINVFLGEYAAQSNTLQAALAEAAYMTGLERNGDIVKMAAYAPLFGNLTAMHWAPDLIWFNNHTSTSSVNYYVQKIFSVNAGTALYQSELNGADIETSPFQGKVGVGTWSTSAEFDNVKIVDNDSGEILGSDNFSSDDFSENWQKVSDGAWSVKNGKLVQSSTSTNTNQYATTGTAAYFGNNGWSNYTYTLDAVKTGGAEGFLIPFSVNSSKNNYFWNIGGWGNTVSCLQQVSNGTKSDQISGTVKNCVLKTGVTYKLKVVVKDTNVKCYIDDVLYVDYDIADTTNAESYQVVSTDDTGDIIIKMVNVTGYEKTFAIDISGAETIGNTAAVDLVAGNSLNDDNILGQQEVVTMTSSEVSGIGSKFNYTVPKYSVTVLRVKTK
jgi:alpha-L-arabinofuranosidase